MANVMITGTGRSYALGFNLVRRYLEAGDTVIATVRKPSADIDGLREQYKERLIVATMDLLDTASVNAAAAEVASKVDHIDTLINNAVGFRRTATWVSSMLISIISRGRLTSSQWGRCASSRPSIRCFVRLPGRHLS